MLFETGWKPWSSGYGGRLRLGGHEFEYCRWVLDKISMLFKRPIINEKEDGDGPYKKSFEALHLRNHRF